ncbi:MAG: hypothetical protein DI570_19975 [Phenylobacterium zucineum]|nr:MAG: hypothetical protein DI570_19975 [Phenylobacterium zucineum]
MKDLTGGDRERLLRLERLAKARDEAAAVDAGVAETVALSRARGQAVAEPEARRHRTGGQAYRRQTGLDWLAAKGRIGPAAKAAGERYGQAYRRLRMDKAIPSTLSDRVRGEFVAPSLAETLSHAEGTEAARRRLDEFRRRLGRQPDLVSACDLICGEEKTPREACVGDRDAGRLEAVLKVALDLLCTVPKG